MDFFKFRQNPTIHTDLAAIQHLHYQNKPFVPHLHTEDPGPSLSSVVAILPDFDGLLPILPKPIFLYRCIRHTTPKMPKIFPLSPTCSLRTQYCRFLVYWQYWQISINSFKFRQNSIIYTDLATVRPSNGLFNPLSPTCSPRTQGPRFPV